MRYAEAGYNLEVDLATGMDLDKVGLEKIVKRSRNLHRAFNILRGMRREDEKPPEDHWRRRYPELEQELLSTYYAYKGWNSEVIPTREMFKEPDSGLPLKCDMCESEEDNEPLCVQWCLNDALIYEEREEEVEEAAAHEELEIGLQALAEKHGLEKIMQVVLRMAENEQ